MGAGEGVKIFQIERPGRNALFPYQYTVQIDFRLSGKDNGALEVHYGLGDKIRVQPVDLRKTNAPHVDSAAQVPGVRILVSQHEPLEIAPALVGGAALEPHETIAGLSFGVERIGGKKNVPGP